jgi:hypothetical protein
VPAKTPGSESGTSRSTRDVAVELLEGRISLVGAKAPEAAIADPESFLALLDTEVYWEVA